MEQVWIDTSLSRLAFCDLVLDTAMELERARLGHAPSMGPLNRLADTLSRAAKPIDAPMQPAFMEPTFYDPFERLFRSQKSVIPESIEQIQTFVAEAAEQLRAVEAGNASPEAIKRLVDFCVGLHQAVALEVEAEEADIVDDWRTSDVAVAACIG
jgi:hypothetical protein